MTEAAGALSHALRADAVMAVDALRWSVEMSRYQALPVHSALLTSGASIVDLQR